MDHEVRLQQWLDDHGFPGSVAFNFSFRFDRRADSMSETASETSAPSRRYGQEAYLFVFRKFVEQPFDDCSTCSWRKALAALHERSHLRPLEERVTKF